MTYTKNLQFGKLERVTYVLEKSELDDAVCQYIAKMGDKVERWRDSIEWGEHDNGMPYVEVVHEVLDILPNKGAK